jgi:hypothetical protein
VNRGGRKLEAAAGRLKVSFIRSDGPRYCGSPHVFRYPVCATPQFSRASVPHRFVASPSAALIDTDHLRDGSGVTGTGTDCVIVAAPAAGEALSGVGMHTAMGEAIGSAVYRATRAGAEQWSRDMAERPPGPR